MIIDGWTDKWMYYFERRKKETKKKTMDGCKDGRFFGFWILVFWLKTVENGWMIRWLIFLFFSFV